MAKYLVERGHHVTLIVIADRRRLGVVEGEWGGVRIVETPDLLCGKLRSGWDPWNTFNRILYLHRHNRPYDLAYCFETRPATIYPVLDYLHRRPVPWITEWIDWWGRGGIIDEFRPGWYRILFGRVETYYEEAFRARADGLTVISTALAERAVGLGVERERICILPNGTQPEVFSVPETAACRHRVGLDVTGPVIGYCSLDTHLDLALMIEVLAQIVRQYPDVMMLVDAVSAAAGVEIRADEWGADVCLTSSQKALALPPGPPPHEICLQRIGAIEYTIPVRPSLFCRVEMRTAARHCIKVGRVGQGSNGKARMAKRPTSPQRVLSLPRLAW